MIVLDAPTNLGLRPPAPGVEPGVKRLAEVLRGCGIVERLGAGDAGRVVPPAYVRDDIQACRALVPGYTRELAERLGELLDAGERPLVLGGDCSILLGAMLALRRRGRYGLLHVDGHLDFRHPGWSGGIGAVAGEDLAGVTGRLEPELSDIDGLSPYVADTDTVHLGERERDPGERAAIAGTGITVVDLPALRVGARCDRRCRTGCTSTPTCSTSPPSTPPPRAGSRSRSSPRCCGSWRRARSASRSRSSTPTWTRTVLRRAR